MNLDAKYGWNRTGFQNENPNDPYAAVNERLARAIWKRLCEFYPGHPWGVAVNHERGMAQVMLPTFTNWSYNIRLSDLAGDPGMRVVINGAGELLERYRMPRAGFDVAHYLTAQARFKPQFNMNRKPPD